MTSQRGIVTGAIPNPSLKYPDIQANPLKPIKSQAKYPYPLGHISVRLPNIAFIYPILSPAKAGTGIYSATTLEYIGSPLEFMPGWVWE